MRLFVLHRSYGHIQNSLLVPPMKGRRIKAIVLGANLVDLQFRHHKRQVE